MLSPLEKKLAEFREKFKQDYKPQLAEIIALWRDVRVKKQADDIDAFLFSVHKLKGSSGALNFLNLSDRLGLIEQELYPCKDNNSLLSTNLVTFVDRHMNAIIAASKTSPDPMLQVVDPEVSEQSQPNTKSELENDSQDTTSSGDEHNASNYSDISIALIDDDKAVCELMAKLLKGYGFDVECFSSISTYAETEKTKPVDLILLDLVMPAVSQQDVFDFAAQQHQNGVVVYVMSSLNSFDARLGGVRAKVEDYLLKPVNIITLVSKIRKTFKIDLAKPHKILLLDDQAIIGNF
ncbi:response regulator, partial [Aliiglaciecola sp.]|nr:response regulator [Aliiglaciecola sp.]